MKKVLSILLIAVGFIIAQRFCVTVTDGFALNKIVYPIKNVEHVCENRPTVERCFAKNILTSQTFYYLGSGDHCYAFVNRDKTYVLKLFKFERLRKLSWLNALPMPKKCKMKISAKLLKEKQMTEQLFNSFNIAYNLLKEETGLTLLHLNQTADLSGSVRICDRQQNYYQLDLNKYYYVLQEHATLSYDQIDHWMHLGNISKARSGIKSLVKLAFKRCQKGVFDLHPSFKNSFGFVNGKAKQIVINHYSQNTREIDPEVYGPEIIHMTRPFRNWLEKYHEALVEVLDEEVKKITANMDS